MAPETRGPVTLAQMSEKTKEKSHRHMESKRAGEEGK